jgi:hypothetical protein
MASSFVGWCFIVAIVVSAVATAAANTNTVSMTIASIELGGHWSRIAMIVVFGIGI